jgi:hypothetical protein
LYWGGGGLHRAIQNKRHGMTSSLVHSMSMHVCIQLLPLGQCWSISTGCCLTAFPKALSSLWANITCLPTRITGCDHST